MTRPRIGITTSYSEGRQSLDHHYVQAIEKSGGLPVILGIRAENMEALKQPADDALKVRVLVLEPLGSQNLLTIQLGDDILKLSTHPDFPAVPDEDIWLRFPQDKVRWMDYDTNQVILPE
jgi:multiple sugar transport system ATP-binding protein